MQLVEKSLVQNPLKRKDGYILQSPPKPIAGALDEFRLTPYHTLQASTIKGTPCGRIYVSAYSHFNG